MRYARERMSERPKKKVDETTKSKVQYFTGICETGYVESLREGIMHLKTLFK